MKSSSVQVETRFEKSVHRNVRSLRAIASGATHLFDIFIIRTPRKKRRTPEDDARNLHRDLERIGQDFARALSNILPAANK